MALAPFVDTVIASLLPTGTRTALYYADRINQLPLGVLGIALGTVLLPEMSTKLALGDGLVPMRRRFARSAFTIVDVAFRRRVSCYSRHNHARYLCPWRFR